MHNVHSDGVVIRIVVWGGGCVHTCIVMGGAHKPVHE